MLFRRKEEIEHVYRELYASLEKPDLPFLRLKILELLYHFQTRQTVLEENHDYMAKKLTEKIKHVKDHLIEDRTLCQSERIGGRTRNQLDTTEKWIQADLWRNTLRLSEKIQNAQSCCWKQTSV